MNTVEQAVGRQLRDSEQIIDLARLDIALARAKNELDRAIHDEMLHATLSWIRVGGMRPLLHITRAMLKPLERLEQVGRDEAWNELERAGYQPARQLADIEPVPIGRVPADYLARNLSAISIRISQEHTIADLSDLGHDAVARALLRVPGGRDIASRIVSTALMNGMSSTWEQVGGDVAGWEYTAVLDGAECRRCKPFDGRQYATYAEAMVDLPNGGPNPLCLGGGRCRCRIVPLSAAPTPAASERRPPDDEPPESLSVALTPDERNALVHYAGVGHEEINRWLRGETVVRGVRASELQASVGLADGVIRRATPIAQEMTVWRNYQTPLQQDLSVGDIVEDPAFTSTTRSRRFAENWGTPYSDVFEITLPVGTRALDLNKAGVDQHSHEEEILLPAGSILEITGLAERVTEYPNGATITGRYVYARLVIDPE